MSDEREWKKKSGIKKLDLSEIIQTVFEKFKHFKLLPFRPVRMNIPARMIFRAGVRSGGGDKTYYYVQKLF